jgi:hypothetical protein
MLLERKTVHVPAQPEIDADLNEWGFIGAKCCAAYGHAAVEAGAPDYPDGDGAEAARTGAIDAIANILHWLSYYHPEAELDGVVEMARRNHAEELRES